MDHTKPAAIVEHAWEVVETADKRRVKRCKLCLYAFEFCPGLPCTAQESKDKLAAMPGADGERVKEE